MSLRCRFGFHHWVRRDYRNEFNYRTFPFQSRLTCSRCNVIK